MPSAAHASPANSVSRPAIILSSVDLPAPFGPSTPILAPGKNESEISFSTWFPGPKVFESPEVTYTYCGEAMPMPSAAVR